MIIYNYLISGFLRTILLCSAVILCIIIVILSLLQSKQSDDAINVFSGQSTNLYTYQKKKGLDKTLTVLTGFASFLLFVIIILLNMRMGG